MSYRYFANSRQVIDTQYLDTAGEITESNSQPRVLGRGIQRLPPDGRSPIGKTIYSDEVNANSGDAAKEAPSEDAAQMPSGTPRAIAITTDTPHR